jgi:hypothetical protein
MAQATSVEPTDTERRHRNRTRSNAPLWLSTTDGRMCIRKKIGSSWLASLLVG